jgi:VWFA-related protein
LDVKRAPGGASHPGGPDSRGQFTLPVQVNLVVVPVTVKDGDGRLVEGLLKRDFSILENGAQQPIKLFTSDPFPLSVAIVMDSNLPDQTLSKVRNTLPALAGAFSQFDEVSLLTYANTVIRRLNFGDTSENLTAALRRSQPKGRLGGPPVYSGPMTGAPTPSVNGRPLDPSAPSIPIIRHESSVLNDAILAAAGELGQRDRSRRKVIFVISDGREDGSNASYNDVLKVLLSNNISVYALAVDAAAIPGYNTLEKIRIPRMGYGNILPKYVSATGGEVFAEFTQDAIESAYARITEQARNQYTLGYSTRSPAAGDYRSIEVLVHRPGLYVHAKDGYYPLPPARPALPE